MLQDAMATGTGFVRDGKRIDPQDVRTKVSSPELASLAAKYVNMSDGEFYKLANTGEAVKHFADVRSLAASVLAQAEGNPRK